MAKQYQSGGKHEPGGIPKWEQNGGKPCDISRTGAGMGTAYDNPNTKDWKPLPGGKGSSGTPSKSKPK